MSTIGASYKTIIDLATDRGDTMLVELLSQKNGILLHLPQVEANDGTGHKTKIRTGLPTPTWRALYQGVQPTRGSIAEVRDSCGNLEDYGHVDKLEYQLAGDNRDTWRMWEDAAHIEGISQAMASTFIYGNVTTAPDKFHGLAPRYNALSGVNTADNVVSASGSQSDNTSIYLAGFGPTATHAIFPKGTMAGLQAKDLGEVTHVKSDGSMYQAMRTHYQWTTGLTIRDWRTNGRIANIDVSDVRGTVANQKALITLMIQLKERVEEPTGGGEQVFLFNRTIRSALRQGIIEKISNQLTWETVGGRRVMVFDDTICERCDAILNTETVVS